MAEIYERNVFINCPFDGTYAPLMRAIVFAVVDCGFTPRCALERADASEIRIQKIYRVIRECGLGVHDLSHTQLDARTHLPRFNMPLEFGIFLGAKFLGEGEQCQKSCLVFDEEPYRYQMYLSDVAGQDIEWHDNNPRNIVCRVRDWLASVAEGYLHSGSVVWDHYQTFQGELSHECTRHRQKPEELTYSDVLRHIFSFRADYVEELEAEDSQKIQNPSAADIKTAVKAITTSESARFLILTKGANGCTYVQAYMEEDSLWIVEFQDGHLNKHFQLRRRTAQNGLST